MLRTIVLHGRLGTEFGLEFRLDVASPAEALRALMVQLKGFREHFRDGHYRVVRGRSAEGRGLELEECKMPLGRAADLHFVPVVAGAASGLGKVLAGIALIGLAVFAPAGFLAIGSFNAATVIGGIGASLALGGIAQMLAPSPKLTGGTASVDRNQSFLFGGGENVLTQGGPVPLVYGRFLVGSVVISAGLDVEQLQNGGSTPTIDPALALAIAGK